MEPDTKWLGEVFEAELGAIRKRRSRTRPRRGAHRTLVGLALSGGGIRSATTNLGILQALSKMDILPLVDYISTVSGGGYIGTCLSSLLSWKNPEGNRPFSTSWESFPFNPDTDLGAAQISHLRTHGSFLLTRNGLLTRETMRSIGVLLSGTVYHLALAALALTTISLLYISVLFFAVPDIHGALKHLTRPVPRDDVAYTIKITTTTEPAYAPNALERGVRREDRITLPNSGPRSYERTVALGHPSLADRVAAKWDFARDLFWNATSQASWVSLGSALGVGFLIAVSAFYYLRGHQRPKEGDSAGATTGESVEDAHARSVLRSTAWPSLLAVVVWLGIIVHFIVVMPLFRIGEQLRERQGNAVLVLVLPVVLLGVLRVTTWILHMLIPRLKDEWTSQMRSLWGAYQTMTTYALWIALLLALFPVAVYAVREHEAWAGLSGLFWLLLARLLTSRDENIARRWRLPRTVKRWLLGVAVAVGMLAIVVAICASIVPGPAWSGDPRALGEQTFAWALVTAAALVALGFIGDANRLSPHYFYRDRLAETYLRTDAGSRDALFLSTLREQSEILLQRLHVRRSRSQTSGPPYHLISCAINLAGSRDLTRKDRKSGYFLFSKLFCGSRHTGYIPTRRYMGGTKVARAMTVSGAAASSGMGAETFFAQAFATVLFNLRLGFWLPNPRHAAAEKKENWWPSHFWPKWLWREITLRTDERSRLINLSDGGHTGDNVGIYPLLQRQCKLIIACDAECDPSLAFGSFTEALRHAYIDLKIDVDIDLTMLRPDTKTGKSRSHCAVGLIRYAPNARGERPGGYLVYLKNSLTGDEPEPILNYKTNHPSFPHESTADQFFDDAQFESYRALGYHIAEHTFARWIHTDAFRHWRQVLA